MPGIILGSEDTGESKTKFPPSRSLHPGACGGGKKP